MLDWNERVVQLTEKLKKDSHRVTPQRVAILKAICTDEGHPSADEIYAAVKVDFPMTSLATVYKTIGVLKDIGEVMELEFSRDANRYDGKRPYPHPHVVCTECGRILDPEVDGIDDLTRRVVTATGFQIKTHRLDFYGLCQECQQAS